MADWPPNHPAPCGGWKDNERDAVSVGEIAEHYDDAAAAVRVIKNTTQVFNPDCSPECCDPATKPPPCDEPPVEPCCAPGDCCGPTEGCPPTCPEGETATVAPTPRPSCTDPITGDGQINDTRC